MKPDKTYTKSSSFYVASILAAALLIVFVILSFFLYVVSNTDFIKQARHAISTDGHQFLRWHDEGGRERLIEKINLRMERGSDQLYLLVDENGTKLAGMLNTWPELKGSEFFDMQQVMLLDNEIDASWHRPPFIDYEFIKIFTQTVEFSSGEKLLIGRNLYDIERLRDLTDDLVLFAIIALGCIVVINFLISLYVVNRVNTIINVTRYVTKTGDLSSRIKLSSSWDDLSYLAKMINALMDYIESLVDNIKQVSDNIAHDLRTPLTRLHNDIDALDENQKISAEQKQQLKAESQTLLSMFSAILRISEIESGKHFFEKQSTDLHQLLEDVIEFFEPVAMEKDIPITHSIDEITIPVDRDLLFQAMLNLMENAIKFTPNGGIIKINSAALDKKNTEIIVADSGVGIPKHERENVFKRFYRTDQSRTHKGNGLGLSMVKAIIEFHNGKIRLEDNQPGLRVVITLPNR